jgi:hypothetical protein
MLMSMTNNFHLLERTMMAMSRDLTGRAAVVALTRTATQARRDVMEELPKIFDRPTPFTVNSIRYQIASRDKPEAKVYISDDAVKGLSPRKYLGPEIDGGPRNVKRSERALINAGAMQMGQWLMPGSGMSLDKYGNVPAGGMVRILSKLSAFGEQGYRANVSEATRKRLERAKRAVASTRTDVFVGHTKGGGEPLAIYQLTSRGHVRPILVFANKAPMYRPRFDFHGMVNRSAAEHWPGFMAQAMRELIQRR